VISCNLAISLAQRGGRVLLVDADLRRSSLHKQLDLDITVGLSSVLIGAHESDAVQNPLTDMPNLYVLPAGPRPPSPVEMLASDKMGQMLKRWATEYDYVVLDTAPLLPVIDTLPLAVASDAVILVVRSGWSRKKALTRMRDHLHRANAHIVGVIVNGIDLKLEHYYSDSSRYGYGYRSNYRSYYQENDATN
jgi:capsular exopolysaccharide synthesis family protein